MMGNSPENCRKHDAALVPEMMGHLSGVLKSSTRVRGAGVTVVGLVKCNPFHVLLIWLHSIPDVPRFGIHACKDK